MRSLLFVPGVSEKMMRKARDSAADGLIFDLEDAVAADRKTEARDIVARLISETDFASKQVFVRINRLDTGFGADDVRAMAGAAIAGLVIPKVERAEEVTAIIELIKAHRPAHLAPLRIICMIESPRGVLNCPQIADVDADADASLEGLLFGSADFSAMTRARLTPGEPELLVARSRMLYSARAAGIAAYDAPFFSIPDLDGLRNASENTRNLGYDGRAIIHPSHIAIVNEVYSPSAAEIEHARGIVAAMQDGLARGLAAIQYQGNLIEPLHARAAQRILDIAEKLSQSPSVV